MNFSLRSRIRESARRLETTTRILHEDHSANLRAGHSCLCIQRGSRPRPLRENIAPQQPRGFRPMTIGIEVPYNDDLEPLQRALAGVRRPGDFFVQGSFEAPMPRIVVRGAGVLSFPVPSVQAEAVIAQGERAPYGRGRETVLDTSVRKVWQRRIAHASPPHGNARQKCRLRGNRSAKSEFLRDEECRPCGIPHVTRTKSEAWTLQLWCCKRCGTGHVDARTPRKRASSVRVAAAAPSEMSPWRPAKSSNTVCASTRICARATFTPSRSGQARAIRCSIPEGVRKSSRLPV